MQELVLPPTPISPNIPLPASPTQERGTSPSARFDDENEENDLFPNTVRPLTPSSEDDPSLIPLPPSPIDRKPRIPSRAPVDWISSLPGHASIWTSNRDTQGAEDETKSSLTKDNVRSVSARLPSGPLPLVVGGRKVSGAMQHAMMPAPSSSFTSTSNATHPSSPYGTDLDGNHDQTNSTEPGEQKFAPHDADQIAPATITGNLSTSQTGQIDLPEGNEADENESRKSMLSITNQQEDEVWMQYVRDQLSTLFPDYFDPNRPLNTFREGSDNHRLSRIEPLDHQYERGITEQPLLSRDRGRGYNENNGRGIPDVRQEIGGLREEIERLRGVVGGLAEGLHLGGLMAHDDVGGTGDEPSLDMQPDAYLTNDLENKNDVNNLASETALPRHYIENAQAVVDLIKMLSKALEGQDSTSRAAVIDDEGMFSSTNLSRLIRLVDKLEVPHTEVTGEAASNTK